MRITTRLVLPCGLLAIAFVTATDARAQYLRGVNVSQAEWGDPFSAIYGSEYSYPSAPTFNYFASRGLGFIRLQVLWERLQPVLGGPLDATNLSRLQQDVAYAKAAGAVVSIVPHNQARYATSEATVSNPCIIDNPCMNGAISVTAQDLADFWVRISNVFKDEPAVVAYDLMNEPHDMGVASWAHIAQTVVSAIRANGDNKLLMIPGDDWSNATFWPEYNGATGFISDPANHYFYEAHEYFDADFSGSYAMTYDQELVNYPSLPIVGVIRLQPFVSWCQTNNVPCYLGEYGIPGNDPKWETVLNNFLNALDAAGMPGTYWAAGELWAGVPGCACSLLSVQPSNNFTTDAPQTLTLLSHLGPGTFRSASAAGDYGWASAPGELVAGYGSGLAAGTEAASSLPLPATLQQAQVQLTDSHGSVFLAPLLYASPQQINYQIPSGVAMGLVNTQVLNAGTIVAQGVLELQPIAPSIFAANYSGQGVAAAQIQRLHPGGAISYENVFTYDSASGQNIPAPIAFGGDTLYLLLYGTGFDNASGTSGATVTLNGSPAMVTFSGPQGTFAGLDQINVALPNSLAGAGEVTVVAAVDGSQANPVTVTFQ